MEESEPKKSKVKLYLISALILVIFGLGIYGYLQYKSFTNKQLSADIAITENNKLKNEVENYNKLKEKIDNEKDRCEKLIIQEEGNFANFTYCQDFLDFFN
jgi:uncharacterized protein (UPF0333 family)